MTKPKPKMPKRCPWCGAAGPTVRRVDAAGVVHWFHVRCDIEHRAWLAEPLATRRKP